MTGTLEPSKYVNNFFDFSQTWLTKSYKSISGIIFYISDQQFQWTCDLSSQVMKKIRYLGVSENKINITLYNII